MMASLFFITRLQDGVGESGASGESIFPPHMRMAEFLCTLSEG